MPALRSQPTLALLTLLAACASPPPAPDSPNPVPDDPHSQSRPNETRVTHLALDLSADFASQSLTGTAQLSLQRLVPGAPLVLDTAPSISVLSVHAADGSPRPFLLAPADPILGSALTIPLEPQDQSVSVRYSVRSDARAVQWLAPEQTASRRGPFLFTQGQAILTRSWIPLQDSPGVRITWEATIRQNDHPELAAVMSAQSRSSTAPGITQFAMPHPVPSYLIALAIGALERRELSPRCAVWAEPGLVELAAQEFEDVERMVSTCESLYGPYRWGRYDVLVLPPSFPFGGMENPCLTFATPTILAGDKSLVALIAHELAHSWSGNLVTNATWRDFWLNEGFTVYVEQRIVEAIFGAERARAETQNGITQLESELASLPEGDQRLHLELSGRDPDDAMTAVAYDKGAAFLRRLELAFGRARFDRFVRAWFDEHAFRSLTTEQFLAFLQTRLLDSDRSAAAAIDVADWVHGKGLPADCPRPRSELLEASDAARERFVAGASAASLAAGAWSTPQWLRFLNSLPAALDRARLVELDEVYGLTRSGNSELLAAWLERNLAAGYLGLPPALDARLGGFLREVGRRKFVKPLFAALAKTPEGLVRAKAIYAEARQRYHAVTRGTIDQLLGWSAGG
ncbi:MAG: M1 family metallopeptidase [Planctomycetes bacterium]|nr:M1 family metallopeptidase [Planctomycetota bacterium]